MKQTAILYLLCSLFIISCKSEKRVVLDTTMGMIEVKLYNQTPQHRDNFLSLVKEGAYD